MEKKSKVGQRVAVWSEDFGAEFNGQTGEIVKIEKTLEYGDMIRVNLDSCQSVPFYENELYFPDHYLGYNQQCFNRL